MKKLYEVTPYENRERAFLWLVVGLLLALLFVCWLFSEAVPMSYAVGDIR